MADFDWTKIAGPLLGVGGTVLGTLVGGPAGAVLGPLAGKALAEALGCDETPDAAGEALGQPDAAGKVASVEASHGAVLKTVEQAYLDDIADARAMQVANVKEGSSLAWAPVIISTIIVVGFLALTTLILFHGAPDNQITMVLFGSLATAFGQVNSFWLGSSSGSRSKDSAIAGALKDATDRVAKAVAPLKPKGAR